MLLDSIWIPSLLLLIPHRRTWLWNEYFAQKILPDFLKLKPYLYKIIGDHDDIVNIHDIIPRRRLEQW